jgi:hypothetical protein
MHILKSGEISDRYAAFRPTGTASFREAVDAIKTAIHFCHEKHIERVLVNTTGLVGVEVPTVAMRYFMARDFAKAAPPGMKLVIVADQSLIDAQKFGVTAALNFGLRTNVFTTELQALEWLLID